MKVLKITCSVSILPWVLNLRGQQTSRRPRCVRHPSGLINRKRRATLLHGAMLKSLPQTMSRCGRVCPLCKRQTSCLPLPDPLYLRRQVRRHGQAAWQHTARRQWLQHHAAAQQISSQEVEEEEESLQDSDSAGALNDTTDQDELSSARSSIQLFLQWLVFQGEHCWPSQ